MHQAKGTPTPMVTSYSLSTHVGSLIEDESVYKSIIKALQYIIITRHDITFAVNKVCQFMHRPLDQQFNIVKHILRYLQATLDYEISFTVSSRLSLVGDSNANWGINSDYMRSTTGFCVFLEANPVPWASKKQQVVSRSIEEAKLGVLHMQLLKQHGWNLCCMSCKF